MKKTLSVFLAVLLSVSCFAGLSAVSSAADTLSGNLSDMTIDQVVYVSGTATVPEGVTVTIADGGSIVVPSGASLKVGTAMTSNSVSSAKVSIKDSGTLQIQNGGSVTNYGTILTDGANDQAIYVGNNATFVNKVYVPGEYIVSYSSSDGTYDHYSHTVTYKPAYLLSSDSSKFDSDAAYLDYSKYTSTGSSGATVSVPYDAKLYVTIRAEEGGSEAPFIDTGRMPLSTNGNIVVKSLETSDSSRAIDDCTGIWAFELTSAAFITVPDASKRYSNCVRQFTITLPYTDSYYTEAFGYEGKGLHDVTVNYGSTLSFRVVLSKDYDKSDVSVYFGTYKLTKGADGYYTITGPILVKSTKQPASDDELDSGTYSTDLYEMSPTGGIQQNGTIMVLGVISNKTQGTINNVLSLIKQIFQIIKEVFEDIFGSFSEMKNIFSK